MSRFALPAVLLGALILSTSAIFVRLSEVGPIATGMYRMLLALPVFWLWMIADDQRSSHQDTHPKGLPRNPRDILLVIVAGLFYAADLAVWHTSVGLTTVANATALGNTAPVFVAIASFVLFKERITRLFFAGLVLAMAGTAVLIARSFTVSFDSVVGDALGLLTGVFYAGYILTVARVRRRVSTSAVLAISGLTCGLILGLAALILGEQFVPLTTAGWVWLFGLAYLCQLGGQSLIIAALAYLPTNFGAVALLVQPIGTAIIGWIILSEAITIDKAIGIAAILGGIWLARKGTPVVKNS
ncbi:MAG: DMT family transporter [Rhodospirillaceae bacterium]|nr:DMT family transporter [Rhodospirillaceae bacterium]MBT5565474.1 DMT family transporter [Rhodospirillaceae bacterium]MBT6089803.1 DMT family transporter [Rhodospirillaceae bacterium]MBT7451447.1 DMT family transporter [Rhodospirillaceae bacterium]